MAGKHTTTVDELREQLTLCTDAKEYDRLVEAIRQAEKGAHLHQAALEADRRAREAAERAARVERHQANVEDLATRPAQMLELDQAIFNTMATLEAHLTQRYALAQSSRELANRTATEAKELGMPTPPALVDPNDWTDRGTLGAFAKSWIDRFFENGAEARRMGITLKLAHLTTTTVGLHKLVRDAREEDA